MLSSVAFIVWLALINIGEISAVALTWGVVSSPLINKFSTEFLCAPLPICIAVFATFLSEVFNSIEIFLILFLSEKLISKKV